MSNKKTPTKLETSCPNCGKQLQRDGELLRCVQHGLFFRYGPRLLVQVPHRDATQVPLMPWQTLNERAVG